MPDRFLSISGFILAGGESRRMGRDKAKLVLGTETLLERQIRLLQSVCRSVTVLGRPKDFPGLEVAVLADLEPGRGPLGGLATGLSATRTEYNLFLSCDLPLMEWRFLHWLAEQALESRAEALVPKTRGGEVQPLCAVYARRALPTLRATLAGGQNQARGFFPRVRWRVISWAEIARAGFSPRIFDNMNTPQDYEAAKRVLNS